MVSNDQFQEESKKVDESMVSIQHRSSMARKPRQDRKVHLIIVLTDGKEINKYFTEKLNELSHFAPLLPVISKADHYEKEEIKTVKEKFMRSSKNSGINWFDAKSVWFL